MAGRAVAQDFEGVLTQRVLTVLPGGTEKLAGGAVSDPAALLDVPAEQVAALDSGLVQRQEVTITVKGDRMRIDGIGGARGPMAGAYTLLHGSEGLAMMVMPASRRIVVITADDARAMAERMRGMARAASGGAAAPEAEAAPAVTELGERTLDGYTVRGLRVTGGGGAGEAWVSPELLAAFARFDEANRRLRAMSPLGTSAVLEAAERLGYPLVVRTAAKAPPFMGGGEGVVLTLTEVTSVRRDPVSDDLFQVPADYTQGTMAQMFAGPPRS
ncbi:MAG TPA: DUF4412 domain-containing protein [Longimicrobium sp.]|nr:DUF4412 domain-containing protein [Longimicrobium sp.]